MKCKKQCEDCGKLINELHEKRYCYHCWYRRNYDHIIRLPMGVDYNTKMRYIIDTETTGLSPFEKIEEKKIGTDGKEETIRKTITHRIICATAMRFVDDGVQQIATFAEEDEKKLLENFFDFLVDAEELIGFNINFDLEFLYARSLLNKVKIPISFRNARAYDLRKIINPFNYKPVGRLRDYVEQLGFVASTDNGSEMPKLYAEKNWAAIKRHCEEDVELTAKLLKMCVDCNLVS